MHNFVDKTLYNEEEILASVSRIFSEILEKQKNNFNQRINIVTKWKGNVKNKILQKRQDWKNS